MKAILIAALMIAVIVSPADAGYLTIKSAGDNPNFQILVDGSPVQIYPDGTSPTITTGNTAVVSVEAPGIRFEERITTKGSTVYQVPYGARVSTGQGNSVPEITPTPTPTPTNDKNDIANPDDYTYVGHNEGEYKYHRNHGEVYFTYVGYGHGDYILIES